MCQQCLDLAGIKFEVIPQRPLYGTPIVDGLASDALRIIAPTVAEVFARLKKAKRLSAFEMLAASLPALEAAKRNRTGKAYLSPDHPLSMLSGSVREFTNGNEPGGFSIPAPLGKHTHANIAEAHKQCEREYGGKLDYCLGIYHPIGVHRLNDGTDSNPFSFLGVASPFSRNEGANVMLHTLSHDDASKVLEAVAWNSRVPFEGLIELFPVPVHDDIRHKFEADYRRAYEASSASIASMTGIAYDAANGGEYKSPTLSSEDFRRLMLPANDDIN